MSKGDIRDVANFKIFIFCLAADLSGKFVAAGGEDGVLRVWSAQDRKLLREQAIP